MPLREYGFSRKFAWVNDCFGVSWASQPHIVAALRILVGLTGSLRGGYPCMGARDEELPSSWQHPTESDRVTSLQSASILPVVTLLALPR